MAASQTHRSWTSIGLPMTALALMLGAAELAKRAGLLPVFVPGPVEVGTIMWDNPALVYTNVLPTLYKASAGYAIAAIVALCAGSIAVLTRQLYNPIYNLGVGLHSIPIIATAPLLALSLGNGPQVQIAIGRFTADRARARLGRAIGATIATTIDGPPAR